MRSSPTHRVATYHFGDDTTTITVPEPLAVAQSPDARQPEFQDTVSFLVTGGAGSLEVTASHFSSGNRAANLDKFASIIADKRAGGTVPQAVLGDINTEVQTAEALQALADQTGMVIVVSSLKIRKLRGLQDQLHKRMDQKDTFDSMFAALEPSVVDAEALAAAPDQWVAWPGEPERCTWRQATASDVAQAWMDDRILTDHGVLRCPLVGGTVLSLDNAARANYDKYNIQNEARIGRRRYLEGQQVVETCVADAVLAFLESLPLSATLDADLKQSTLDALRAYRDGLQGLYAQAYATWDDADDLCTDQTPLGGAMKALGRHSKTFVSITRALSWEDIRDAPAAREQLKQGLTEALIRRLGVGSSDGSLPLGGLAHVDAAAFAQRSEAKIEAAWERMIKRQAAGDLYKLWFPELLEGQTTGGMPIPADVIAQPTAGYIAERQRALGLVDGIAVTVEALR